MYSMLDSCTDYKDYIDYAKSIGQKAICFTEHANLYDWGGKKIYAEQQGLKYLHGVECYLTETHDEKIRDNYHTILIAKNQEGFVELNNLVFLSSHPDHKYYKWRLSFDEFLNISDNIIKISACLQSPLNRYKNSKTFSEDMLDKLLRHYDYYEIQYHGGEQIEYNRYLYEMSKKYNKPLIAATDTHSLNQYKAECRTMLQYGKTDGLWGDSENEFDLTYKTYDELVEAFKKQDSLPMNVVLEAIENTNVMADSCEEIVIDTSNKYPILYGEKDEEVLWDVIKKNLKDKIERGIIPKDKQYLDNIKEEMRVFKKIDMIGFMLFMSEIMSWARDNGIATGFARGSVAGSTVAYITNITDVDPIKWKTVFSRFANENRVEAGDIDTDWYEDDRQKVYDHIINRFGTDKTAYIFAAGTLADKAVIDVIGKAYRIKAEKEHKSTPYTLDRIAEIKKEYDNNPEETKEKYSDIFYYYDGLKGCVVSQGQHPAGLVVSSINLVDNYSGFIGEDGQIILPNDMTICHDFGAIKYDILGLKSVGVIDKVYKMIGKKFPRSDEINWNDQAVYDDIAEDNTAIFQFESDYSGQCLKKFHPTSVEELSLVNACIRPSGETYRDELLARKMHVTPSDVVNELLKDNYGRIVYQEDILAFLQNICGFDGSSADNIRRAIGKKQHDVIEAAMPKILDGYCNKSDKPREVAEVEAKEFLDVIYSSSSYAFNKGHSVSYTLLSYVMAYCRYYYPTEFCTAFLNCSKNDDDILNGTKLAEHKGCTISSIRFRYSQGDYSCDPETKTIYKGLSSIKYLGNDLADELYELGKRDYTDFIDLLQAIDKTSCDSRQLDILIKLEFFKEFGSINMLLKQVEIYSNLKGRKQIKLADLSKYNIPLDLIQRLSQKQTAKMFKDFNWVELVREMCKLIPEQKTSIVDILKWEQEYLGYMTKTLPNVPITYYFVTEINQKYKHPVLTLYRLYDKHTRNIKVKANNFDRNPISKYDVINIDKEKPDRKWRRINGEWTQIDEYEDILEKYTKIL